jgi:predicted transcriptional regulator
MFREVDCLENCIQKETESFLDYYDAYIRPALKCLDVAIKCQTRLTDTDVAALLNISEAEVSDIKKRNGHKRINRQVIMTILSEGSSPVCRMYRRELSLGSPFVYTIEQVAYIYGIELLALKDACRRLGIYQITRQNIFEVFGATPLNSTVQR